MSLEESMTTLAESNLKLAKALSRYADVIEANGVAVVSKANTGSGEGDEGGGKASGKTTTSKATKATSKTSNKGGDKDEGDDDGLGGDGGKSTGKGGKTTKKALTFDEVKAKLLEVKELGGREAAAEIFGEYGYSSLNNVQEKHYQDIYDDAQKYLDDNAE